MKLSKNRSQAANEFSQHDPFPLPLEYPFSIAVLSQKAFYDKTAYNSDRNHANQKEFPDLIDLTTALFRPIVRVRVCMQVTQDRKA